MPYETERLSTILATHENDTFAQPVPENLSELSRQAFAKKSP